MTAKRGALAALERLRTEAAEAGEAVRLLELECRKAARSRDRAESAVIDYHRGVAAGERKPDAAGERKLMGELADVRARTTTRVLHGDPAHLVDLVVEGRLAGARQLAQGCESEVVRFIVEHRDELVAELVLLAEEARDRLLAERSEPARAQWAAVRKQWSALIERWGISPRELPPVPGDFAAALAPLESGRVRDPRELLPMPKSLAPGPPDDEPGVAGARTLAGDWPDRVVL